MTDGNDVAIDGGEGERISLTVDPEFLELLRETFPAALSDAEALRMAAGSGVTARRNPMAAIDARDGDR